MEKHSPERCTSRPRRKTRTGSRNKQLFKNPRRDSYSTRGSSNTTSEAGWIIKGKGGAAVVGKELFLFSVQPRFAGLARQHYGSGEA